MVRRLSLLPVSILKSKFDIKIPVRVMHFCTFRCNLSCKYCGIWKTPKKEMNTEEVKRAMLEFANAGTIFWTFTGGEPLLRQDIGDLVDYSKSLFPIVTLTTNGLLLKERLNEVKNVNYFTVSLDGPKKVTDQFRGNGTYDKAIEGIKAAREIGKDVIINAVISKSNTEDDFVGIKKLIDIAQNLGCRINFSMIYEDQFNSETIKECLIEKNSYIQALNLIKEYKKNKFNFIMFSNPCIEQLKHMKKWKNCYAGRFFCDLFPDGTVVPCLFKENQGFNGLKYGFVQAFKNLPKNENCVCPSTCYNELNCIFSFRPKSIFENFLKYITFISH
jgi:MoaA/NifB/PqqE/SkfB family radical SAM enzyme